MMTQMTSPILDHKIQWKLSHTGRDKLDAIMDMFSDLLADDHKDALRLTIMSPKEVDGEPLTADGRGRHGGSTEVHP